MQLTILPPDVIYTLLMHTPTILTLSILLSTHPIFPTIYTQFYRTILRRIVKTRYHEAIWDLVAVALTLHELPPYPHAKIWDLGWKSHWPSRHGTHSFIDDNDMLELERPVETVRSFANTVNEVEKLADMFLEIALLRLSQMEVKALGERATRTLNDVSMSERMRVELPLWAFYVFKKHDEVCRLEGVKRRGDEVVRVDPSAEGMIVDVLGKQNPYQVRTVEEFVNSFRLNGGSLPKHWYGTTLFPGAVKVRVDQVSWFVKYLRVREDGDEVHVPLRCSLPMAEPEDGARGVSNDFVSDLWKRFVTTARPPLASCPAVELRMRYFAVCMWDSAKLERLMGDVAKWHCFHFPRMCLDMGTEKVGTEHDNQGTT